jgi:amino acid adenylation domain-containing protein
MNPSSAPHVEACAPAAPAALALSELLGLPASAARAAWARHAAAVPDETMAAIASWARHDAADPCSAFVAAWMILLARWGARPAGGIRRGRAGQAAPRGRPPAPGTAAPEEGWDVPPNASATAAAPWDALDVEFDLVLPAGPWLRRVDRALRAAGPAPDPSGIDWAWDDAGEAPPAPPGGGGPVLILSLDANRRTLVALAPTELAADLAERLLARVVAVAHECCSAPERTLREFDALGAAERARVLEERNPPFPAGDPTASVHATFLARATARPEAVALKLGDTEVRYGVLADRSHAWARALRAAGVGPGATVGLALDRSIEAIVALLAILRCGAAYVPLDSAYPPSRLAFILDDAQAALLVTSRDKSATFAASCAQRQLLVDEMDAHAAVVDAAEAGITREPSVAASDLAYVMYTSGSTGTPKGVEIPHDAILRLVVDAGYVGLAPDVRMLHAAPLGFDASTLEIWGPLLNGGTCVLHPEELPTPGGLQESIRSQGVTTAWLTAALFNAVVDDDPAHLAGLRELLIGGEALSVAHVRRFLAAQPATTLINGYGPTECTTFAATFRIPHGLAATARAVPIGRPVTATQAYVLGPDLEPLPEGLVGRLYLGGRGLARGYLRRPELTSERFLPHPFAPRHAPARLYDTGDLARGLPDGTLDFLGRADTQVKMRGFRIELGEIEAALAAHARVQACAVLAVDGPSGNRTLAAYIVPKAGSSDISGTVEPSEAAPSPAILRAWLHDRLPEFMVPSAWVMLERLPVTVNGKLDRKALPAPAAERPELAAPYREPENDRERLFCDAFAEVLGIARVGRLDNFFELGGNSLQVLRTLTLLGRRGVEGVAATMFFRQPTPAAMAAASRRPGPLSTSAAGAPASTPDAARAAASEAAEKAEEARKAETTEAAAATPPAAAAPGRDATAPVAPQDDPIAIIAVAGRFPGARDVDQFWANLLEGRDGITHFADGTLDPAVPAALANDPAYVKARGLVDGVDLFDAAFFGISPREADLMDPQQRLFLELSWECLERAGHVPDAPDEGTGAVGVFAGMSNATYYQHHVRHRPDLVEKLGEFAVMLGTEKDYIATRTAYRLNLTGPAVSVHTACSTSLVAIAQAFWSLRQGQCRMALAGGASITCPPRSGYLYQEGAMLSPDGATRSFDAAAQGTVFSDGVAVVLLKRLSDALADGNDVLALIRGVAVNNDGRDKASFTAPSVEGQAAAIAEAQRVAGVEPRSISYVEAHGTATPLGDPVEIEALTQAFRRGTADTGFCRLGSLKSNVGHLVIAAGAAGVIKTALALREQRLPPTIHFERPHPAIDFAASPFVVNDRASAWPRGAAPRRAGVSSFGVGGTNAHAVLEEAPPRDPPPPARGPQRLQVSARTAAALEAMAGRLADHLELHPEVNLADAAHTLQHGRSRFAHRLAVVASTSADAAATLRSAASAQRRTGSVGARAPALAWMFPGQGAQYAGMGRALDESDPDFARGLAQCLAAFAPVLAFDLRPRLFDESPAGAEALRATGTTQPALFCIEYALAHTWLARGLSPAALVGHSVGEFVAAVLAGVMSLEDAARLVARRGELLEALPPGAMLSVRMAAAMLEARLPAALSLAADNGPQAAVVAGPHDAVDAFARTLESESIVARRLVTSHAFHSDMMAPAVAPFEALVRTVRLAPPRVPIASTATGRWLGDGEATDPAYWARHLRAPVRFSPALRAVLAGRPEWQGRAIALLELGPRDVLSTLARQHGAPAVAIPTLGDTPAAEVERLLLADGQLWTLGIETGAPAAHPPSGRRRVALPTYAFERRRHWVDAERAPPAGPPSVATESASATSVTPPAELDSRVSPIMSASASNTASGAAPSSPRDPSGVRFNERIPSEKIAMNAPTSASPRHAQLVDRLRELFGDVAGLDLSQAEASAPFVDLGIDSLTLTQVAIQTKKRFGVAVTFRQLSESCRCFEDLAAFLDDALPAPAAPTAVACAPAGAPVVAPAGAAAGASASASVSAFASAAGLPAGMPAAAMMPQAAMNAPAAADASFMQQVIQQQMTLMAQQLAMLNAATATASPTLAGTPPAAAAMPHAASATAPRVDAPQAFASLAEGVDAKARVASSVPAPGAARPAAAGERTGYDVKKAFGAIARIHTQGSEVTPLQRARLNAFVRRYVERTARSKAYTREHRPHLADPRVVNGFRPLTKEITYQIVIEKSRGSHLWDVDGNEYVDVLNGFGMNLFGWSPQFVQEAVRRQIDSGYEIGPQHPLAGEVARLVCELTGFDRAGLCNTGSEAVMAALRIARTVTCRNTVVMFSGSYHGTFDEVLVRAGRNHRGIPAAPGIMPDVFDDCRVLDYGTPEALAFIRENADDLAAVLVEPVQSRRPEFQPREFLRELRAITERSGTCLIFDEVITGFRMHPGGVQAMFDVRADLATYGKVIGGGMPIGVVAGKREFMDALDGGAWQYGDESVPTVGVTYFAGTFVRHPLALAAAQASLRHLKQQGGQLQEQLNLSTAAMADELGAYCREVGAPMEIRHFGSLWRVGWQEEHPLQDLLFPMMRSRGVHILDNFPCFMTTAHTPQDIATIKSAFRESVAELQAAEFLPRKAPQEPVALDVSRPPVPGARLGRGPDGQARWYAPDPTTPGKYVPVR